MLLVVLFTGLIYTLTLNNVILQTSAAEPGYLDFDNLPETNFSCDGKVIGGYYADTETGCQMFHVCTIGQKGEVSDIKFLCLNGTVFDQETRVCERLDEVDCSKSESYYDLNLELYGNSGATYGIQPENEEETTNNDEDKCLEEEEDCKTEPLPNRTEAEDEYEEIEEPANPTPATTSTTTSTTTTSTTTVRPTTSARPPQIPYPTSSPETIAALLALHNAFQESLKEHERPAPERGPGVYPTPTSAAVKPSAQNIFNKERVPPPPPPRFSSPVSFSTSPRPISFVLNSQNYVPNQGSNTQPGQVSNHHFPAPSQNHKQQLNFQFNLSKPKPVIDSFAPTIRTSQAFGNSNFQQTYQQDNQEPQLTAEEEDEEYSVEDYPQSQPSTTRPFSYNPYRHNHDRFPINHEQLDTEAQTKQSPSTTSNNFLLQQLKLRFNENQSLKHPSAHGFTRAISSHQTKLLTYPEKPPPSPLPTPAAVSVVLSKSSTSSIVRSVSSRNQSAISVPHPQSAVHNTTNRYVNPTTTKPVSTTSANVSQPASLEDYKAEEEYEDYLEDELEPDPFYKDIPKLDRQRRHILDYEPFFAPEDITLHIKSRKRKKEVENQCKRTLKVLAQIQKNDKYVHSLQKEILVCKEKLMEVLASLKEMDNTMDAHVKLPPCLSVTYTTPLDLELVPPTPPSLNKYTVPNNSGLPQTANSLKQNVTQSSSNSNGSSANRYFLQESTYLPIKFPRMVTTREYSFTIPNHDETIDKKSTFYRQENSATISKHTITSAKYLNLSDPSDWFNNSSKFFFVKNHTFSTSMCTKNELIFSQFNLKEALESNSSSPTLLGVEYISLCRQSKSEHQRVNGTVVFLFKAEKYYSPDILQNLRENNSKTYVTEWKTTLKALHLVAKDTFKVIKEKSSSKDPQTLIQKINELYSR